MSAKLSPITPAVLTWAVRQDGRSVDDVAQAVSVDPGLLREWMAGEAQPTVGQVTRLAEKLHRPRVMFSLPQPPEDAGLPDGFRSPVGVPDHQVGQAALTELRRARRVRRAVTWARSDEPAPDLPRATLDDLPADAARRARAWLGVGVGERWATPGKALERWRSALTARGVLVFELPLGRDEVRGFASPDERAPLIVSNLNAGEPGWRMFTLGHELGHLMLRQESACSDPEAVPGVAVERWCERFSAALLMPGELVREILSNVAHGTGDLDDVKSLMSRLRVSGRAAAARMGDLGLAQPGLYVQVGVFPLFWTPV